MNNPFFDTNGLPTEALLALLELCEVSHDGTLPGIFAATQSAWYQSGKLRADIQEKHGDKRERAMPIFDQLGLLREVSTQSITCGHAIVLGAKKLAVRKRIASLVHAWRVSGARFSQLVFCGSNRLSDESVLDNRNAELPFTLPSIPRYVESPNTEIAMMEAVYTLARDLFPWNDSVIPIFKETVVTGRNASTHDTLMDWDGVARPSGDVLIASSQPFVSFQALIATKCLPQCRVHAIGAAATPTLPISVYLDNISKFIFELCD